MTILYWSITRKLFYSKKLKIEIKITFHLPSNWGLDDSNTPSTNKNHLHHQDEENKNHSNSTVDTPLEYRSINLPNIKK